MSDDYIEDVESDKQVDPWRKKASTTARYDLCYECKHYTPQKPYMPGVRCRFGLRPAVRNKDGIAIASCDVFCKKA